MTLAIYTDASFRGARRSAAGLAAIVKIVGGPVVGRTSLATSASDSHDAECQAVFLGLNVALILPVGKDLEMRDVILISDSESLVLAICKKKRTTQAMRNIMDVVDRITERVQGFRVEHRSQSSDPEMGNVDYMSKNMLISKER